MAKKPTAPEPEPVEPEEPTPTEPFDPNRTPEQ